MKGDSARKKLYVYEYVSGLEEEEEQDTKQKRRRAG